VEPLDGKKCLRVQSVCLFLDERSFRYEWSRYKHTWECKDDSEMGPMIPGVMNDFFLQPGPDLLRARVWVDDQRLEFEWNPEDRRWNAMDTNGDHVHLDTQRMSEIISEPMNSLWAVVP